MTLTSGLIGVKEQASQVMLINMAMMAYMSAYGMQSTACTVVGNQIGRGNVDKGYTYCWLTFFFAFALVSAEAYGIYQNQQQIINFLTDIEEIQDLIKSLMNLFIINLFPDALRGTLKGAIKGLGA